ncbi:MAG TPA: TolC family protein, partial [Vicinamibacterales bacterium]
MTSFLFSFRRWRIGVGAVLLAPAAISAQDTLTLHQALARGAGGAVAIRAARAQADAASAMQLGAWRSALPAVRLEAGFLRTTDPVGAFGTSLRQQRITSQDFDPSRLNFPPAADNFTGALVIEQPIVVLDGWLAARAAARGSRSASFNADWAAMTTEADIIGAWYGVVVAADRAVTLAAATRAADAHAHQAALMLEAGMVTKSDVLLAQARAGALEAQRLDAVRDSVLAGRQLVALIGASPRDAFVVHGRFPDDSVIERAARDVGR